MAAFLFADAMLAGRPIQVFNEGRMARDFTFIDDIVAGTIAALDRGPPGSARHALYNLGNHRPVKLLHFIEVLEEALGRKAEKHLMPMQPGDVRGEFRRHRRGAARSWIRSHDADRDRHTALCCMVQELPWANASSAMTSERGFAVIGLGYVGLPVALALARKFAPVWGFDISERRIRELREGHDRTREASQDELKGTKLLLTARAEDIAEASVFIVTVPTPIDGERRPDLRPIIGACTTLGRVLRKGSVVIFELTVYPGLTRDICGPRIAAESGLRQGTDFKLGYSPERINPGDRVHRLETIIKVVAGEDAETLERVAAVYEAIVPAGVYRATSIEVAEAAKVIENTQRDLNIALMNELSIIFDRLGIPTADVLKAAGTKWNFLPFTPGLVGGHCIGVDPYYLTARAEAAGYYPQVILSGRRINDGMGAFVAQRLVKLLCAANRPIKGARVGILGLTFKENVPDLRNSRVPDIIAELKGFGIDPIVHDPMADALEAKEDYGLTLVGADRFQKLDALIYAVPHRVVQERGDNFVVSMLMEGGVLIDLKSVLPRDRLPSGIHYWAL